jgi:hypothetical protein
MSRTTRALTGAAAAVAALVLGAAPANAALYDHFVWSFSDASSFDDCGFTIDSTYSASGNTVIQTVRGTNDLYYAIIAYRSEEVLTNPATGAWFRVVSREVSHEMGPATQVSDTVWHYTIREAGNPVTFYDSTGAVVTKDTGLITWSMTFDTLGDGQPSGDVLSEDVESVAGPHPLLYADFCEIATRLIG